MIKNLKRLFVSILTLIFCLGCIVNTTTFASSWRYPSDGLSLYYDDYEDDDFDYDSLFTVSRSKKTKLRKHKKEQTYSLIDWDDLCQRAAQIAEKDIPSDPVEQQKMVCQNLYPLFRKAFSDDIGYGLKDVFSYLCENDRNLFLCDGGRSLSCKIRPILNKEDYKIFYSLYQSFMSKFGIRAKNAINVKRVDALFLLSYMYQRAIGNIPDYEAILSIKEEEEVIRLLDIIFSGTVY